VQSPQVDGQVDEIETASSNKKHNSVKCSKCDETRDLWICLVCGYVGCGRYTKEHAKDHFLETNHNYAMCLSDNKVWDYANDVFVHRLLQSNNFKQVELEEKDSKESEISKQMLALEMECMQLLSQQLDSQRQYWEDRLLEERLKNTSLPIEKSFQNQSCQTSANTHEADTVKKDVYDRMKVSFTKTMRTLQDERAVSKALSENYQSVKQESIALKEKVKDLEELTRDLQFHIQSQEKTIQEQIAGGDISGVTSKKSSKKVRKK